MKFSLFLFGASSSVLNVAHAKCNERKNHPRNGGYYIEGAAGYVKPRQYDPVTKTVIIDSTWATPTEENGLSYKDGKFRLCTGMFCSPQCKIAPGCQDFMFATTCGKMRFQYPEDSGDDVWLFPTQDALDQCDFTEATQVCNEGDGKGEGCDWAIEEDAEMEEGSHGVRLFASKKNCNNGLALAVYIQPYVEIGTECYNKGLKSLRVRDCECPHMTDSATTLSEPCHTGFFEGCRDGGPDPDKGCCDTAPPYCVNNIFNKKTDEGKKYEKARAKQCVDWKPGKCVTGDDQDTKECCKDTCTSCGIKQDPFMVWSPCTLEQGAEFPDNLKCGRTKKHGPSDTCDFEACAEGDHWHPDGDNYKQWRVRTSCHEDPYATFAMKVKNDVVDETMTCAELQVHKKTEVLCQKNTKQTAEMKSAESMCKQTCSSCSPCYQNEKTIVYAGQKNGEAKYAKCKNVAKLKGNKLEAMCAITTGDGVHLSPYEGCPQSCQEECK